MLEVSYALLSALQMTESFTCIVQTYFLGNINKFRMSSAALKLSTLGKIFTRQHFEIFFFFFFPENRIWHFIGDNLHDMFNPVFWEK